MRDNYSIITNANDINKGKWSDFVTSHPKGNAFQTVDMYNVYENTKKYEPVFLAALDDQNEICAILLAVIQREYPGVLGRLTTRSIIHGGPLIKNDAPDILDFILKKYNEIIVKKAIYSQFRNFRDWDSTNIIFEKNGFVYENHLNILVDLTKSEEQLWKEVHSKRRNEVRRARKEGTSFSVKTSESSLKNCYAILQEVYDRAKLPIPEYSFFYNLFHMHQEARLLVFTAYYKDEIIGCMLALCFGDTIYDFYAGSLKTFYKKYPNDLIPWEVFKWGKKNNFKVFDFGGAGKLDVAYGVREYKKKFGGQFVEFGRYEQIHQPIMFKIAKIGFKIWQNIK